MPLWLVPWLLATIACSLADDPCPTAGSCLCVESPESNKPICMSQLLTDDVLPSTTQILRLHNSHLTQLSVPALPNLHHIYASNNSALALVHVPSIPALVYLDLSHNALVSVDVPHQDHLTTFNLTHNRLTKVLPGIKQLPSLQILDLSHNWLSEWPQPLPLSNLTFLNLSHNNFSAIRPAWLEPLISLKHLDLCHNRLTTIPNDLSWSLLHLEYLDLSHNSISAIGLLSFRNLHQLQYLDLSNNALLNLQDNCLRYLTRLQFLDLSFNPLRRLHGIFVTLARLRRLDLRHLSQLELIEAESFKGLESLEVLLASHSALSDIQIGAFEPLVALKSLDLSHNNLTRLPTYLFRPLSALRAIVLRGNPWQCDCYMYWVLLWLDSSVKTNMVDTEGTHCGSPAPLQGQPLLESLNHHMTCINVTINDFQPLVRHRVGNTIQLHCAAAGVPQPATHWVTPQGRLRSDEEGRLLQQDNGTLVIQDLRRGDNGFYHCIASNPMGKSFARVRLALDYDFLVHVKLVSLLVGLATSVGFLLLTLLTICIQSLLHRCGIESPCLVGAASSPKAQQIRRILESMEQYKTQQLERLRENYTFQVQRIKDNCMQQMERLRDSYSGQIEHLRNIRDYGNHQIDRIRDNYYFQVQRVRDYSTSQIDWLRENYIFQRNRIRKFSTHQLVRLRENYKLQQQHLNKILETLNLENCKTNCSRTDSIMMEPELEPPPPFMMGEPRPLRDDTSSLVSSAYFTPDESDSESPTIHLFLEGVELSPLALPSLHDDGPLPETLFPTLLSCNL
ncbi:hypothetical protein LAZ67_8000237 [Cordylochernes scorpioides]|uniref:Ig-like domain-containing protein n=1 Tax=Cordylochernes scorpioides TaxID=51811 RepID=A0ABY6KPU1_9ARAC|nr:hypothetical protein LAZ67_8000237 [Cordylochernes scorpioides]